MLLPELALALALALVLVLALVLSIVATAARVALRCACARAPPAQRTAVDRHGVARRRGRRRGDDARLALRVELAHALARRDTARLGGVAAALEQIELARRGVSATAGLARKARWAPRKETRQGA